MTPFPSSFVARLLARSSRLLLTAVALCLGLASTSAPALAQGGSTSGDRPKPAPAAGTRDSTKQVDVRTAKKGAAGTTVGGTLGPVTGLPPVITPPPCALRSSPSTMLAGDAACRPCSDILTGGPTTLWRSAPACTPCARPGLGSMWSGSPACGPQTLVAQLAVTPTSGYSIIADQGGSYSPPGAYPIEMWRYDFGAGGPTPTGGTPSPVGHTYVAPGTYAVTLTVRNTKGDFPGSITRMVTVRAGACIAPLPMSRLVPCGAGFMSGDRAETRLINTTDPGPGLCSYGAWLETSNTCVVGAGCTAGPAETRDVACGAGYLSGTRTERRDPNTAAAGPGACPFGAWNEIANTCVAATPCAAGSSETRTVPCGAGYVSGSRTEQRDPDTGSAGPGACPFDAWYEIGNTCVASRACTPGSSQSRFVACAAGFTGTIIEQRDPNPAAAGPGACPFNAWYEASNTCVATSTPCTMPAAETRTVACGAGYLSGSRFETRTGNSGDAGPGTCSFGAWTETSNTCVAANPCTPGAAETRTLSCGAGMSGSITERRSPDINAAGPGACAFGAWTETSNTCACAGPLSETRQLACTTGTGTGTPQQRDKAASPSCGWGPWYNTGATDCTNAPLCTLTGAPAGMLASDRECAACNLPGKSGLWYNAPSCVTAAPRRMIAVVVGASDALTGGFIRGGCSGAPGSTTYSCSVRIAQYVSCLWMAGPPPKFASCGHFVQAGAANDNQCFSGGDQSGVDCGIARNPTSNEGPFERTEDVAPPGSTFCVTGSQGYFGPLDDLTNMFPPERSDVCLLVMEWVYKT